MFMCINIFHNNDANGNNAQAVSPLKFCSRCGHDEPTNCRNLNQTLYGIIRMLILTENNNYKK